LFRDIEHRSATEIQTGRELLRRFFVRLSRLPQAAQFIVGQYARSLAFGCIVAAHAPRNWRIKIIDSRSVPIENFSDVSERQIDHLRPAPVLDVIEQGNDVRVL